MVLEAGTDVLVRGEDALINYLTANMEMTGNGIEYMRYLYQLSMRVTQGVIVELGAYLGRSAITLAWDSSVPVYSIDSYTDHVDWSGRVCTPENMRAYQRNTARAGVLTTLICGDVRDVCYRWQTPIGLLLWDIGDSIFGDWCRWRKYIVPGGLALLRDLFDRRFGSDQVIDFEAKRGEFVIENRRPGFLTLRRHDTSGAVAC